MKTTNQRQKNQKIFKCMETKSTLVNKQWVTEEIRRFLQLNDNASTSIGHN